MELAAFWYRRDLRLEDNTALNAALKSGLPVLPIFIFDTSILNELPADDARVSFIYERLITLHQQLRKYGSSLLLKIGEPFQVWTQLIRQYNISSIYTNEDYEPYAIKRDESIRQLAIAKNIIWNTYKDQVLFSPNEIVKPSDNQPYTIYTPYKNKWLDLFSKSGVHARVPFVKSEFFQFQADLPLLGKIGFKKSRQSVKPFDMSCLDEYQRFRDFPALDYTSYLSVHLRFGTVSIREIIGQLRSHHTPFLQELIWREFFMQILFHFPHVIKESFKAKYDAMVWRKDEADFEKWKAGETGYPLVDAGMRELNETGYMHNRIRMVVASFLCKHLLIDWRWGEAYFAEKLLDYELSSNNGNWQWAAGTGCDAAPYFRIFNPTTQQRKFDPDGKYVKKWASKQLTPMVDHNSARERALFTYKQVLK